MHDVNLLNYMKNGDGPDNRRNMFSMLRTSQKPPAPQHLARFQNNITLNRRQGGKNVTFKMF